LQGIEFARKESGRNTVYFGDMWNLQETENTRKDKVEHTRKGNCKEWNLEVNETYTR